MRACSPLLAAWMAGCASPEGRWRAILQNEQPMPELRTEVYDDEADDLSIGLFHRDLQWVVFSDGSGLEIEEFHDMRWVQANLVHEQSDGLVYTLGTRAIGARGFTLAYARMDASYDCSLRGEIAECLLWWEDDPDPDTLTMQRVGPAEWLP